MSLCIINFIPAQKRKVPNSPSLDHSKLIPTPLTSESDLTGFDCDDGDLNDFIRNDALRLQEQNIARTTCIAYDGKIIGYYTLICDTLALEKKDRKSIFRWPKTLFKSYPAIKLARMAFIKEYQRKGVGTVFLKVIKGLAQHLNERGVACRFVTVDAYPDKVDFYKKNGFEENLVPEEREKSDTVSMRFDILK